MSEVLVGFLQGEKESKLPTSTYYIQVYKLYMFIKIGNTGT